MVTKITTAYLQRFLKDRDPFSHKNDYGEAVLVAGSRGMIGAALLAARGCLRSGVGLLTVHVPRCGYTVLQLGAPEAKCEADDSDDLVTAFTLSPRVNAVAIGPGLTTQPVVAAAVIESWHTYPQLRWVVDADALNILALHPEACAALPPEALLTPHPGEMARLTAATGLADAAAFAARYGVVVVLKGHHTRVYTPAGEVLENTLWGNAGMAVGGSGDTLTGILLSLRAQGYTAVEAATLGVALHALAADLAIREGGQSMESLLPSDYTAHLGAAFRTLHARV